MLYVCDINNKTSINPLNIKTMKNLTKKELIEKINILESQVEKARNERKQMFNKYSFINELEEEIKKRIESEQIESDDDIREYIEQELDNTVIYYKTCFEICMELNATSFDGYELGEAKDICQLAYLALYEYVNEELNFSELEQAIEDKQSEEN